MGIAVFKVRNIEKKDIKVNTRYYNSNIPLCNLKLHFSCLVNGELHDRESAASDVGI